MLSIHVPSDADNTEWHYIYHVVIDKVYPFIHSMGEIPLKLTWRSCSTLYNSYMYIDVSSIHVLVYIRILYSVFAESYTIGVGQIKKWREVWFLATTDNSQ